MVIDSQPVANQDGKMNLHERKRGLRIGVGVLAALCAVLLGMTSLSGCRVYVMGSTPRNPFLGEWHTDSTEDGVDFSAEYEFENNGRYSYSSRRSSGAMRRIIMTRGTYRYDDETLFLTPVPSGHRSFPAQVRIHAQRRVGARRADQYERNDRTDLPPPPFVAHRCLLTRTRSARALPRMGT